MQSVVCRAIRNLCAGLSILALAVTAGAPKAFSDANQARSLLKAMSSYVAAQRSIAFDLDTSLEVVTKDQQKVSLTSSGTVTVARPDKVRVTRHGGFADTQLVFDGKVLSLVEKGSNVYSQLDHPGSIDKLVEDLRSTYKRPLPAADLLNSDPYTGLMQDVTDVKDLGSGVIRGAECDHLAFRARDVDWQIWIAQGDAPYPLRFSIVSKEVKGSPQYTVDLMNWKTGNAVKADDFSFKAPSDGKKVKPNELVNFDELPTCSNQEARNDDAEAARIVALHLVRTHAERGTRRISLNHRADQAGFGRRSRRRPSADPGQRGGSGAQVRAPMCIWSRMLTSV